MPLLKEKKEGSFSRMDIREMFKGETVRILAGSSKDRKKGRPKGGREHEKESE